ncbi:hypothetical protein SEA_LITTLEMUNCHKIN_62 [Gordonia phage LittleMunchkin]|nr:hypothetical protein SEA_LITTLEMUNCHKIN_62 [Gordonia phage LittleMunchkin]
MATGKITEPRALTDADPVFAEMAMELWRVRKARAMVKARREEVYELMRETHARAKDNGLKGDLTVGKIGESHYVMRSATVHPKPRRTVSSARAKKAAPVLWKRANTTIDRVGIAAPKGLAVPSAKDLGLRLPAMPDQFNRWDRDVLGIVTRYQKVADAPWAEKEKQLKKALREYSIEHLGFIEPGEMTSRQMQWDGTPVVFGDGWKVGLTVTQYDGELFEKIAPKAVFNALAEEVIPAPYERVYLATADAPDGQLTEIAD